jgi:hypothetical protein
MVENPVFTGHFTVTPPWSPVTFMVLTAFTAQRYDHTNPITPEAPGIHCQWVPENPDKLVWDKGIKFCHSQEWLSYLIENFLVPLGYTLSGTVQFTDDELEASGTISVQDNKVSIRYDT